MQIYLLPTKINTLTEPESETVSNYLALAQFAGKLISLTTIDDRPVFTEFTGNNEEKAGKYGILDRNSSKDSNNKFGYNINMFKKATEENGNHRLDDDILKNPVLVREVTQQEREEIKQLIDSKEYKFGSGSTIVSFN